MKHRQESWKYDAQRSIFEELWGDWAGNETLYRMLDSTSETKWLLKEKLRMQKWQVFHLMSKHTILIYFVFSLWIVNEFENLEMIFKHFRKRRAGIKALYGAWAVSLKTSMLSGTKSFFRSDQIGRRWVKTWRMNKNCRNTCIWGIILLVTLPCMELVKPWSPRL